MKDINRYHLRDDEVYPNPSKSGLWCKWEDIEPLLKELDDITAKALAAVWLIDAEVRLGELAKLREKASELFLGKDKATIARLQDKVARLQQMLYEGERPPTSGVSTVFARDRRNNVDMPLQLFRVTHAPDGGLAIGVYLP